MATRRWFGALVGASVWALAAPAAFAQKAPLPAMVRIIVPATPGSSTDAYARAVAMQLAERTGSNVIVENKPGASTMLGSAAVAKGPKDGSILLINSTTLVSTGASMRNPPLDVVHDLVPVAMLEQNPLVVAVSVKSGIRTPAELVAAARAATGEAWLSGEELPAGAWSLGDRALNVSLVNEFDPTQVSRCFLYATPNWDFFNLELFSAKKDLAPGESQRLTHRYVIRQGLPG